MSIDRLAEANPLATSPDPNWLPSTTVQSTAALVAIVGGLLITRLVALASERKTAEQSLSDWTREQQELATQIEQVQAERVEIERARFRDDWLDDLADRGEQFDSPVTPQLLDLSQYHADPRISEYLEELQARITTAYSAVHAAAKKIPEGSDQFDPEEVAKFVDAQLISDETGLDILISVCARAGYIAERSAPYSIMTVNTGMRLRPPNPVRQARAQALHDRQRELELRAQKYTWEVEKCNARIEGTRTPEGVTSLFAALALFSLLGMLYPIVIMAWRPVPESGLSRLSLVLAFGIGLISVMLVLRSFIKNLRGA